MTLVLRYFDDQRAIDVADRRLTETDDDDVVLGHTDDAVKAFFVRGLVVSYSGLDDLRGGMTVRPWLKREFLDAGDKSFEDTLAHIASVLPSMIYERWRHTPLDIRITGAGRVDGEPDMMAFADGHITNVAGGYARASFTWEAKPRERLEPGRYWRAYGARNDLAQSTVAMLDTKVVPQAASIDIVNHFLTAIRATAPHASKDSVGTSATVSVMPLKLIAQALDTGEAEFAYRSNGTLADGYLTFTWVAGDLPSVTMVPRDQVRVVLTDDPPPPESFIG